MTMDWTISWTTLRFLSTQVWALRGAKGERKFIIKNQIVVFLPVWDGWNFSGQYLQIQGQALPCLREVRRLPMTGGKKSKNGNHSVLGEIPICTRVISVSGPFAGHFFPHPEQQTFLGAQWPRMGTALHQQNLSNSPFAAQLYIPVCSFAADPNSENKSQSISV